MVDVKPQALHSRTDGAVRDWMLTTKFNDYPDGWVALFEEAGYTCDYCWTIVE